MPEKKIAPCLCEAKAPHVGLVTSRVKTPGGKVYVGCTRCGRVGRHAATENGAIEHWNNGELLFGPSEE